MPKLGCINTVQPNRLSAGIELVRNALNAMQLIADCNEFPGVDPFITKTNAALGDAVKTFNEVIMVGLQYAAFPVQDFSSFDAYLNDLKQVNPQLLQERVFHSYDLISSYKINILSRDNPITVTKKDQDRLLSSKKIYLEYLTKSFGNETLDYETEGRAYDYLVNPRELRDRMVDHFQYMWTRFLQAEFTRRQAVLEKTVADLNRINLSSIHPLQAAKKITGHDIEQEWANRRWELNWIKTSNKVVFVPSFHMGPYLGRRVIQDAMYIFFSPRMAQGFELSSPDLARSDVNTRLATLADDIRLQILKMLTQKKEMSSKQIMADLKLSQSSASRHLKQLSANGFLNERRQNSAKIYSLNQAFISQTMDAVSNYLSGE